VTEFRRLPLAGLPAHLSTHTAKYHLAVAVKASEVKHILTDIYANRGKKTCSSVLVVFAMGFCWCSDEFQTLPKKAVIAIV
jgi:hypothetical protein